MLHDLDENRFNALHLHMSNEYSTNSFLFNWIDSSNQ